MIATFKTIMLAQVQSPAQWIPKLLKDVKVSPWGQLFYTCHFLRLFLCHFSLYAIDSSLISGRKVFAIVKTSWEKEEKECKENNVIQGHFWMAVLLGTIWQMQKQVRLVLGYSVWIWRIGAIVLNMLNFFSLSYLNLNFPRTLKLSTEKPRVQ